MGGDLKEKYGGWEVGMRLRNSAMRHKSHAGQIAAACHKCDTQLVAKNRLKSLENCR
jgi:hypothetical protein